MNEENKPGPYHLERGRTARWVEMLKIVFAIVVLLCVRASAQLVVPPVNSDCATSTDGTVVGVLNPLNPPQVSPAFTGTLGSGNYFIEVVWYDAAAHVTLPSPEIEQQLVSTGQLQISPPASGMPSTAVGMRVFIGTVSGAETLQGSTTGSATFIQSVPLATGTALPSTNTTVCQIIANDSGWPSGTGYKVTLTSPSGATLPGYPLQAQFLGPGNTINLGQGFPFYNGVVTYPVPILAKPYGHGPQGISGALDLTGYNLTSVGRLGVGTKVPGWGVDAEGSGIGGMINALSGFLVNGAPPAANTCLGSTDGIANDTQIACITAGNLPTLYYQTVDLNGTAKTQRPVLNFSSYFTATDSASPARTTISLLTTGSEAKVVTAAAAGTSGNCAQWDASSGIGDSGAPCTSTNVIIAASSSQILKAGHTGTCNSPSCSVTFSPAFSGTPTCVATGWGGSINLASCSSSGMGINSSGVSDVSWMALGPI